MFSFSLQKSPWPPVRPMDRIISKLGRPPKRDLVNPQCRMNTVTMLPTRTMRQERMEVRCQWGCNKRLICFTLAGLPWSGNLPHDQDQGVHSMSDVFIYSHGKSTHTSTLYLDTDNLLLGPGSDLFKKTFENWDLFFKMTEAMDLQRPSKEE